MIRKMAGYISKYKACGINSAYGYLEVLLEIRIPYYIKIVDLGIPSKNIGYVMLYGGYMVVMALLALLFGALAASFGAKAAMGFGSELRRGLFDKVQEFSFSNLDKYGTASLVTRLTTDVNNTQNAFMMIRVMVRAPFMLISATIMAYIVSKNLFWFLAAIPFSFGFIVIIMMAFPRFQICTAR